MATETIQIVDRGRGPQLSTSRLTVLDIFYYLHRGYDFDFIHQAMPSLSRAEFDVIVEYINKHHDELVERDRRAEECIQRGIAEQKAKGLYEEIDESIPTEQRVQRLKEKNFASEWRRRMVTTLLVDANLDGHAEILSMCLDSDTWREIRDHLGIRILHFEDIALDRAAPDNAVWRVCQENGFYLLTANRNQESDDSLEATIRNEGTLQSFPVLTFSDAPRMYQSSAYRNNVVERLLEYLLNPEKYLGAGRLYLP